jgi:hypothetical protein
MSRQLVTVGAKGVGLDDLRSYVDIGMMDLSDQRRVAQVEGVETLLEGHATGVELGAHGAVAQNGQARGLQKR